MRVREGQGVVLLCGPPPHSGGKMAFSEGFLSCEDFHFNCYPTQSVICAAVQQILSISGESLSVLHRNVDIVWYHFSDSSSIQCLSGQSGSRVSALPLRSPGCLFVLLRSVEWVIFTLGHSGLSAWFSMGAKRNFGMQTGEAVCGWGPARLSNRASLWRCFVCFSSALCIHDIINGS